MALCQTRNVVETIFTWLPPESVAASTEPEVPRTAPALRVWTDALLEIAAERWDIDVDPPIAIRKHAWFGWLTPLPPVARAAECAGRVRHEVRVDGARCAVAPIEAVDELLDPQSWRRLAAHLEDQGFSSEMVEEELVPVADPTAVALVDRAWDAVATTESVLLDAVFAFFERPLRAYLMNWIRLDQCPASELQQDLEVVVQADAVLEVVRIGS